VRPRRGAHYGALVIEDVPAVVQKDQRVIEAYLGA
jgi:branched-chain amino acid transport system ATP-binding protein